ncbi:MAG: M3 family oligoendopeptidase [Thermotogae bacterium]|nr:M3 family oligoendopeptidase [Thermotogota bacterium]MCP5465090.1 M3 family oligoendopeptidase [Thermotogota bacterium]HOO74137.1 M3 family oligoendopeptidase [Tepiditoga sp.]
MPLWNLKFFFDSPNDPKIKETLNSFLDNAKKIKEKYYNLLSSENLKASELRDFFKATEKNLWDALLVNQYSGLLFAENTGSTEAQKLSAMVDDYFTKESIISSFWRPVLLTQKEEKLTELKNSPELKDYEFQLEEIIKIKNHTLTEEAEKVISAFSSSSREAFANMYERITSDYEFEFETDGEIKKMNGAILRSLRQHPDKNIRRSAMKMLFSRYEKDKIALESAYNSILRHYDTEASLRNFPKSISMRNSDNQVDDSIVDMVIDVTTERTPLCHKYYHWKSQYIGENLTLADIYAPINPVKKEYSFEDAKKIVLESYYDFDEEFGDIVKSFFDENRIHSDITKGKRGGAFCSYNVPNYKPFVLMNFTGNMRDIMTLAHELGHGIHGTLSSKQNLSNYHTPLTMAEVASVFGEMLVMDKLLKELDAEDKKAFIASKIEDTFATMFRQNMFARFEIKSHDLVDKNGMATWDELCDIYKDELKIMFGDSVEIPEEYTYEWASIPHIYGVPFYVYAYNYANLLVIALYEKYLEEGKAFIPKYKELLSNGGNDSPERMLLKLGIDIKSRDFWNKGFDYIERELISKLN